MDGAAVFKATFSDFKIVKSRKVCQFIFEVSSEGADAAIHALGGLPRPDAEVWCGIARLVPEKAPHAPRAVNGDAKPEKERRPFGELPLSQQAAISCNDDRFRRFLSYKITGSHHGNSDDETAAERVRSICGVSSRSQIVEGSESGRLWKRLNAEFRRWIHDVPFAEPVR